jgi:AAA ATPase domain
MSPSSGLSADDILAYLADDSGAAGEAIERPPKQVQAYREAAAVLVAVEHPENLRPLGGESAAGTVTELLGTDLVPATGRKFGGRVMLAPDIRSQTIGELASTGRLQDALAANPDERDSPLQAHFERYLRQEAPPLENQTLEELEATRQVAIWCAGVVEGVPTEDEVDARAAYLRLLEPFEAIAGDDVFRGRKKELDELRSYIGVVPPESAIRRLRGLFRWAEPKRQPAVSISGPGGVGKSALVARFMLEHTRLREDARVPFGYLDFERANLDVGEPLALCIELLRQLDVQFPGDGRFADIRDRAIEQWSDPSKVLPESRLAAARDLLGDVLDRMRSVLGPRPYVVVLDTFEEVQYRGEARAFPLWDMLVNIQDRAPFLRVVVAGRAPVESLRLAGKPPHQILLGELDNESAMAFLKAQGVQDRILQERLVRTFGRVPLSLKLVSSLAARTPGGAAALLDPAVTGGMLVAASDELIQGQLYERILDHIANVQVRRLAHPGLVLRRINPSVILEVLNEPCGLGIRTIHQAQKLFEQLQRETSLVFVDDADGDLVHRADLRRVMLKMLLTSAPAQVEQIRRRAVAWYARQRGRRGRAEELYHRLHLGERVDDKELSDQEVRSSIQAAVEEFPLQVQLHLTTLGFDVPPEAHKHATREQRDESLASRIEELLPYGPSSEGQAQVIFASAQADLRPGSPLFRAGARIAAQHGDKEQALELIERGLAGTVREGAAVQTLRLLQERAWLYRNRSRADQADGLAWLGEHAQRHQDRPAVLQHRAQSIGPDDEVENDLVALGDLLTQADPDDVWGLVPALQPAVKLAQRRRVKALLPPLQALVQAEASPFRFTVFPDPASQSALEELLFTGADAGIWPFGGAFLRLCEAWPYRILFVVAPYGRRGEQLSESG